MNNVLERVLRQNKASLSLNYEVDGNSNTVYNLTCSFERGDLGILETIGLNNYAILRITAPACPKSYIWPPGTIVTDKYDIMSKKANLEMDLAFLERLHRQGQIVFSLLHLLERDPVWQQHIAIQVQQREHKDKTSTIKNKPILQNIRDLLMEGFTDDELYDLCHYESDFESLRDEASKHPGKTEIVRKIIAYAEIKMLIKELLAWAKAKNPKRYELHKPYFKYTP